MLRIYFLFTATFRIARQMCIFADLTINLLFPCRITSPRSKSNSSESGLGDEKRETDNNTLQVESVRSLQYKWSAIKTAL